jgi:hypothetical protein
MVYCAMNGLLLLGSPSKFAGSVAGQYRENDALLISDAWHTAPSPDRRDKTWPTIRPAGMWSPCFRHASSHLGMGGGTGSAFPDATGWGFLWIAWTVARQR